MTATARPLRTTFQLTQPARAFENTLRLEGWHQGYRAALHDARLAVRRASNAGLVLGFVLGCATGTAGALLAAPIVVHALRLGGAA